MQKYMEEKSPAERKKEMEQAAKRGIGGQMGNQGRLQYLGADGGVKRDDDQQRMLAAEMKEKLAARFGDSPDSIQARASGEAEKPVAGASTQPGAVASAQTDDEQTEEEKRIQVENLIKMGNRTLGREPVQTGNFFERRRREKAMNAVEAMITGKDEAHRSQEKNQWARKSENWKTLQMEADPRTLQLQDYVQMEGERMLKYKDIYKKYYSPEQLTTGDQTILAIKNLARFTDEANRGERTCGYYQEVIDSLQNKKGKLSSGEKAQLAYAQEQKKRYTDVLVQLHKDLAAIVAPTKKDKNKKVTRNYVGENVIRMYHDASLPPEAIYDRGDQIKSTPQEIAALSMEAKPVGRAFLYHNTGPNFKPTMEFGKSFDVLTGGVPAKQQVPRTPPKPSAGLAPATKLPPPLPARPQAAVQQPPPLPARPQAAVQQPPPLPARPQAAVQQPPPLPARPQAAVQQPPASVPAPAGQQGKDSKEVPLSEEERAMLQDDKEKPSFWKRLFGRMKKEDNPGVPAATAGGQSAGASLVISKPFAVQTQPANMPAVSAAAQEQQSGSVNIAAATEDIHLPVNESGPAKFGLKTDRKGRYTGMSMKAFDAAMKKRGQFFDPSDDAKIRNMADIIYMTGFSAKPEVVSSEKFDEAFQKREQQIMYRGIRDEKGDTAEKQMDDYRSGNVQVRGGIYGSGTYFSTHKADAMGYANREGGKDVVEGRGFAKGGKSAVGRFGMKKGARVIDFDELMKMRDKEVEKYKDRVDPSLLKAIQSDESFYAAMKGYDAVRIKKPDFTGINSAQKYWYTGLNRGMILADREGI
jgi:hypothetical protein